MQIIEVDYSYLHMYTHTCTCICTVHGRIYRSIIILNNNSATSTSTYICTYAHIQRTWTTSFVQPRRRKLISDKTSNLISNHQLHPGACGDANLQRVNSNLIFQSQLRLVAFGFMYK